MVHLLKYSEWQGSSGLWYAGDVSDLKNNSNAWYYVPRMLRIPLTDYILLLKDKFNINDLYYSKDKNFLMYNWKSYQDCHKFVLFVNKEARKIKFMI